MGLLRAFIAVEIPLEIRQTIQRETSGFRKGMDSFIRWVPMENMHLTLKFLGDISPASVEMLTQMMRAEAESCPIFDIRLTSLGSFPNPKRPRVIYIGIRAAAELEALQHGIESASRRLGYESEDRSFSPHLTLGRVKQNATVFNQQMVRHALEQDCIDSFGTARVELGAPVQERIETCRIGIHEVVLCATEEVVTT